MSFQMMNDDVEIISKLGDEPNEDDGLDAAGLKAKFDEAATLLKAAHNALVGALNAADAAESVGFDSEVIDGANVKAAMENLRTYLLGQMQDVSQGSVADGSVTTVKLHDDAVTGAKVAAQTLRQSVSASTVLTQISTTASSVGNYLDFQFVRALGFMFVSGFVTLEVAASGTQDVVFEFSNDYSPLGGNLGAVFTPDPDYSMITYNNVTRRMTLIARNVLAAEIGETRTIPVLGWYFCDGEGS